MSQSALGTLSIKLPNAAQPEILKALAPGDPRAKPGLPAYVVLHDSTLHAIAAAKPTSLRELLRVPGVGEAKRKYGAEVLDLLRQRQVEFD